MKLYDCTVRLGGSLVNEVQKTEVTAAEIEVLRHLHGGADSVINIKPSLDGKKHKSVKRTSAEERQRLSDVYANTTLLTDIDAKKKKAMMTELFGHDRLPLPEDLAEVKAEEEAEPAFAA